MDSDGDEPDGLGEDDDCHAVNVESEMSGADAEDEKWRDDAAVDGNAAAESAVTQGGGGPEDDRDRCGYAEDARECLVDLKDCVDNDVPLRGRGRDVFHHVAHDVGDDESADGGCDQDCDCSEDVDDESRKGDAVRRGETAGEAEGSEDENEEADHRECVGDGGGYGKVFELCGGENS